MRLTGETVTVELKNGSVLSGSVVGVDVSMNTHLRNVKLTVRGAAAPLSVASLSVRGSTIRYFILPDSLNLDQLLLEQVKKAGQGQQQQQHRAAGQADGRGGGRGGRGRGGRGRGGPGRGRGRGAGERGGGGGARARYD